MLVLDGQGEHISGVSSGIILILLKLLMATYLVVSFPHGGKWGKEMNTFK